MSEADVGNLQAGVTDEDDEDVTTPDPEPETGKLGPDLITGEPEEKPKEEQPEKKEPDTSQWDRERQERDQEHAAERKELTSRIESLQEQVTSANEAVQDLQASKVAAEKPEDDGATALEADADIDEIVKALNETKAIGRNADQEIASLRKELADRDAKQAERDQKSAEAAAKVAYAQTVKSLEEVFSDKSLGIDGAKYSAEAQKRAQQFLAEKGFTKDAPPSDALTDLALERFFREARDEDPAYKTVRRSKPSVTLDTGTGGAKEAASQRPMTHEQFKAKLRREGNTLAD